MEAVQVADRISFPYTLLISVVAFILLAEWAGACEYLPVYQKASPNIRLKVVRGDKPLTNAKAEVARSLVPGGMAPIDQFTRTGDSAGVIWIPDLVAGDFYSIWVSDEQGNYGAQFNLEISATGPGAVSELNASFPEPPKASPVKTLRGTVMDANGGVIPKVAIAVRKTGGDTRPDSQAETGPHGDFSFELPDGKYDIEFKYRGFAPVRMAAVVQKDGHNTWRGLRVTMKFGDCGLSLYKYSVAEEQ